MFERAGREEEFGPMGRKVGDQAVAAGAEAAAKRLRRKVLLQNKKNLQDWVTRDANRPVNKYQKVLAKKWLNMSKQQKKMLPQRFSHDSKDHQRRRWLGVWRLLRIRSKTVVQSCSGVDLFQNFLRLLHIFRKEHAPIRHQELYESEKNDSPPFVCETGGTCWSAALDDYLKF